LLPSPTLRLGPIPAIPTWIPQIEPDVRYPLKLCTPKSRARTHSIHDNQPKLARLDRDDVWLNPEDARTRGISDGERVRVYNDRGSTVLPARVTARMARGAVSIKAPGSRPMCRRHGHQWLRQCTDR
jgi:anaerobic dimethyl sulfoxide reductase subunit A